jgi:hypothetical protein
MKMNMPGFTAESSLSPRMDVYHRTVVFGGSSSADRGGVVLQLRFQSDPDLGAYWRCKANGGSELVCRFFGGLAPFTIGGLLLAA